MKRHHLTAALLTILFFITVPLSVTRCLSEGAQGSAGDGGTFASNSPTTPFSSYFSYK